MSSLAEVQQLESFYCLYKQHIIQLMEWVSVSCEGWTCYSPEVLQFEVITTHSGTTYLVLENIQSESPHCSQLVFCNEQCNIQNLHKNMTESKRNLEAAHIPKDSMAAGRILKALKEKYTFR